jgi:hypothetical protein
VDSALEVPSLAFSFHLPTYWLGTRQIKWSRTWQQKFAKSQNSLLNFFKIDDTSVVKVTVAQRLLTQLKNLNVPFTEDFHGALKETDHIVDAIFGKFTLSAPPFHLSVPLTQPQDSPSPVRSASLSHPSSKHFKKHRYQ